MDHAPADDRKVFIVTNTYKFSQRNMPLFFFSTGMTSKGHQQKPASLAFSAHEFQKMVARHFAFLGEVAASENDFVLRKKSGAGFARCHGSRHGSGARKDR
jgi:hypothetical protein